MTRKREVGTEPWPHPAQVPVWRRSGHKAGPRASIAVDALQGSYLLKVSLSVQVSTTLRSAWLAAGRSIAKSLPICGIGPGCYNSTCLLPFPRCDACLSSPPRLASGRHSTPQRASHRYLSRCEIVDNYRWLEKDADPESKPGALPKTLRAGFSGRPNPRRAVLQDQLTKLYGGSSSSYSRCRYRGGVLFALKSQPPQKNSHCGLDDVGERPAGEGSG